MNIKPTDLILLTHAGFGVLGAAMALWVFVEALNAQPANEKRIRVASWLAPVFIAVAWFLGGYWYRISTPLKKL